MKHTRSLLAFTFMLLSIGPIAHAQDVVEQPWKADEEVVIQLNGTVLIESWSGDAIKVETEVQQKGHTLGFSNKDKRGPLEVALIGHEERLLVRAKPRPDMYIVGINWYREHVTHRVWVPVGAKLRVEADKADVSIQGTFYTVRADVEQGDLSVTVPEGDVRVLRATASEGKVMVSEKSEGKTFEAIGDGEQVYLLSTARGTLNVTYKQQRL